MPIRDVATALVFLTRLRVPVKDPVPLAQAAWAFPLVGALVGAIGGGVLMAAAEVGLHPTACSLIGLGAMALVTGGLHEDGLADVADGFGAGGDKERVLAIMRDSRIGTFGVLALIFVIGIEAAILSGLWGYGTAALALIGAGAASRGVMPLVMAALPPARDDGLSKGAGQPDKARALVAAALGAAALFATMDQRAAAMAVALAGVTAVAVAMQAKKRIGGQTGDVLGAIQKLTELAVLVAVGGWAST